MMNSSTSRNGLISFTERQWEELEHQALIYKYMASGVPIPPHLLHPIKTTTSSLDFSSNLILHQPQHIGWNCFQLGYGKKIDPEPGRCKRTDGKKWRCSKEAYADSKYCERHMHRGKNRSRKPVELLSNNTSTTTTATATPTAFPISSIKKNYNTHSPGITLSSQQHAKFLLDSGAYSRNSYGQDEMKEEADKWQLAPLTMGSPLGQLKQRTNYSVSQTGQQYYLQHQNESTNQQQRQYQYNHYNMKIDTEDEQQNKKVMHHFFDELPPQDNKDSWLDFEAKTDLSISIPNSSSHDFFINHNGK